MKSMLEECQLSFIVGVTTLPEGSYKRLIASKRLLHPVGEELTSEAH